MVRKHTNRKSNASKLKNAAAKRAAGSGKSAGRKFKIQIPATEERTLPPECSRLGVFGWHDDISGPDAEVVHCFKLTRNELISLGYHYLDRFFSVKRRHRVQCEQSTWEWIEVIFAAKRFCSIERTLSPGRLIGDFQTYINSQWLGIDNLHQAIARKGGKTHAYIDPISTMSIAILPEDEPENRSRRDRRKKDLSEECDGLPFDYCCHEGVDGPDAELVHFPPTRRELKLLAAQYLERRFLEERSDALGYPQCANTAALIFATRRFKSIQAALSPGKPISEFERQIKHDKAGLKELGWQMETSCEELGTSPWYAQTDLGGLLEHQSLTRLSFRGEPSPTKDRA